MKPLVCSLIAFGIACCVVNGAAAQLPELPSGGRYIGLHDSLGYDEFRQLPDDEQREARERARSWLSRLRKAVTTEADHSDIEHGLDCAATAVGYCPYLAEAWIQYADVAVILEQYETAMACIAHARKTIDYERRDEVRQRNLIDLERVRAIASYNVADYDGALEAALFVIERSWGEWETRLVAARCMIRFDRPAEAWRMIALYPENRDSHVDAYAVAGLAALEQGRFEVAEREFERAAEEGLDNPVFENDRGRLYLQTGHYGKAADHFRRAVEAKPDFHEATCNLAVAQKRIGDLDAAESTLTALLEAAPDYAVAHFNLAEVYREMAVAADGNASERFARRAWTEYNLALKCGASPDEVIARRGTLSVFVDDLESAEADLVALTEDPTVSAHVLTVMARVEKNEGRLDVAESILESATQREDATALAFAELGEVRLRRKKPQAAREALERACAMDKTLVVSRINLSIACQQLRDIPAAWAALDEAIAIDPEHPLVVLRTSSEGRPR
jgi:tetratricopeptide (TPR) repeat protein